MSSSSRPRARVIRGPAALGIQTMPFEVDLIKPVATTPARDAAAVERAIEHGYRDGVEAGHRDGYQAGLSAARNEMAMAERERAAVVEGLVAALEEAVAGLRQAQSAARIDAEDEISSAAFAVAEAVIARELELAVNPGRDAVARAFALAPEGDAVVRLCPSDMATLGELALGRDVTILADPAVEPAGAIVEIGACRIDAQISTALERVRQVLA